MKRIILLLVLLLLTLSACGGSVQEAKSNRAREKSPDVSETQLQTLVDGNNAFALDVYQSLRTQGGNLILSPFSISLALAMTYAGARGDTETQMADVLHFDSQSQTHPAFNALDLKLENPNFVLDNTQEPMQLNIANSVFAEQTFAFLPDFLDTLSVNYGAGIQLQDFINQPESSREQINGWVSDQTEDRINDLIPEGGVTADTRMVLVNAIYFKADWQNPFDANDTYDLNFKLLDGTQVSVPSMGQRMDIAFTAGDGFALAELPYAGSNAVMTLLVPDEGRFEEIESSLNAEFLGNALARMETKDMLLRMPKFKYESGFNLSGVLTVLGMPAAFNPNQADFSGMTGNKDLFIGDVIHKAFVAVDEEGTEAAAATAVIMETAGALMLDSSLIIDRPFIYFIRDAESGQILFIGRVLNPK